MPGQKSEMHLQMLGARKPLAIYGLEWGDPDDDGPLKLVRDVFLRPYITPESTVLEIGPGGGRWTRYMLDAKEVIVVDPFAEMLEEHARTIESDRVRRVQNGGTDLPDIAPQSVDFVFGFGVFVHLELEVIQAYLKSIHDVMHAGSFAVLQFSDKTKPVAFKRHGFAVTFPDQMRQLLHASGFTIVFENTTSLPHSIIVLFRLKADGDAFNPSGVLPKLPKQFYPSKE